MRDWEQYVRDRLRGLELPPEREASIIGELAQQLEQVYSDAIAGGATAFQAKQRAESNFPDWDALAKEIREAEPRTTIDWPERDHPESRRLAVLSGLSRDMLYALRVLKTNPAFAAIAVFTLAFGIGANTAIFTAVDALAFHPVPYGHPEQLIAIETRKAREPELEAWTSAPDFFDLRERTRFLSSVAGISPVWNMVLTGRGAADRLETLFVSADFFPLLGVKPIFGRGFLSDDDRGYHGANVVVLSYSFWQTRLGANTGVIGDKLVLDGSPYVVIGVLPPGFRYPGAPLTATASDIDLWLPLASNQLMGDGGPRRSLRFLKVIGRLKAGSRVEQARDELRGISEALAAEHPDTNRGFEMGLESLTAQVTGRSRAALYLLLWAVGLVLLMACANVANLLLARTAARQKEITIRVALGASRGRLLRQLFTEGLVLAVAGGCAGVLLAHWTLKLILSVAPVALAHRAPLQLDTSALMFAMCVVLLSAALSTLPVGIGIMRSEIGESLKEHGRGTAGGGRSIQSGVIVAQMALALVLVIGSGLLIRSFVRLLSVDLGFQTRNLITISTQAPTTARKPDQRAAVYRRIADQVLAMPGVSGIGAVSRLPLMGSNLGSWLTIEGRQFAADEKPEVEYRVATPSYFPTMGIPLLQGRLFDDRDEANPAAVVLINQTAARRYFPNDDPIGKRIKFGSGVEKLPWISIIGVVGDTRHFGLETEPRPEAYRPYAHNPLSAPILVIRTARDPGSMIGALTAAVRSVNPDMPAYNVFRVEQLVARSTAERRFVMLLLTAFAAAALFLAAVGIYGVASQSVAQRTREIGLRMALGATAGEVQRMILRDGLRLTLAGAIIGWLASAAFARFMGNLLFGVSPFDVAAFSMAPLVLVAVAIVACYAPARQATRVDPLVALRHE